MVEVSAGWCVYSLPSAVTAKPACWREASTSRSAWKYCRCCSQKGSPSRGRVSSILVSQVRALGFYDAADHEVVPRGFTRYDRIGESEVHHPVGVEVEDEPTAGPKPASHRSYRQSQLIRSEVVKAVECANRRVEDSFDIQAREHRPDHLHVGAQALASDGQHRFGGVDADDPIAPRSQLGSKEARAAADIENGRYAYRVGTPELV